MTACIVGWAHTPFGKLTNETVESLIVRVAVDALADAGIGPKDVDEIVLGHFNAGFRRRILPPLWFCRPRPNFASSGRPGLRTPVPPGQPRCIRAYGRSRRARPALSSLSGLSR